MSRKYTAQQMRDKADEFKEYLDNPDHFAVQEFDDDSRMLMEMLYQAADILDSIRNEISIIEKMPTANLDGSFENQKVNGEKLMAKIAFYDKAKGIVGEVQNV